MASRAPKKKTKKQIAQEEREAKLRNPLTGQAPNSFTKVTNAEVPAAPGADPVAPMGEYDKTVAARHQRRAAQYANERTGRKITDVPGYGTVDLDAVGWSNTPLNPEGKAGRPILHPDFARSLLGPSTPDIPAGPAINEPHEASKHTPLLPRAEDLPGTSYRKGTEVMRRYGVTRESATRSIVDSIERSNMRTILAGADQPYSRGFYGGDTDPERLLQEGTKRVMDDTDLPHDDARAVVVTAVAKTSPQTKVKQTTKDGRTIFHNHEAAMTSVEHALAGQPAETVQLPEGIMSYRSNMEKAVASTYSLMSPEASMRDQFTPTKNATKTAAFAGAQMDSTGPDSFRVSDVHSTGSIAPHLSSQKGFMFSVRDRDGNMTEINHKWHPEDIGKDGLPKPAIAAKRLRDVGHEGGSYVPLMKTSNGKAKQVKGASQVEEMLAKGGYAAHALADLAGRQAAVRLGWSPSVNHAQASHLVQEEDWGERMVQRPDMTEYTMDTVYPGYRKRMGFPETGTTGEEDVLGGLWDQAQASRTSAFREGSGR